MWGVPRSWWKVHPKCIIGFNQQQAGTIKWNYALCEAPATNKNGDDDADADADGDVGEPVKKRDDQHTIPDQHQ